MALNCIKDQNGVEPVGKEGKYVTSQIPVAVFSKRTLSENHNPVGDKWKLKFEDCETRRKTLISQCQKVERDKQELERRNATLIDNSETIMRQLDEKEKELTLLRKLAKEMFKEYDQLKNRYDLDTGALNQAIQRASKWYKQNRELKRKSTALVNKVMQVAPNTVLDVEDEPDSGEDELDNLRLTVAGLNKEVARLQAELGAAKLQEFEAQEAAVELQASFEEEHKLRISLEQQVAELKSSRENLGQVTRLVAQEVSTLREQYQKEKETSEKHKTDAQQAKRERNVLAHQSQILMDESASDEKLMNALMEIETLKTELEKEKELRITEVQQLNELLEDQDPDTEVEMLREKLKIIELELDVTNKRAERAEKCCEELSKKVMQLEEKNQPPPPPPLPPPSFAVPDSGTTRLKFSSRAKENERVTDNNRMNEMADLLGVKRSAKPTLQQGAIDAIINQIKGGRYILKSPEKKTERVEEQPPVVKEMMNVLGTLRRRPGNRSPSFRRKPEMSTTSSPNIAI